ncbi:hypothetical protein LAZ67_8003722 [Cordylochernes scorpioides]|uniref:Uncharacterized protein n=1 Tax=Cordylochernes scorpioides TaxID=51811 RepID=A0ABY6KRU6_9ARAC|nr:hypothetical protein LAZ67_8003722 [Cordylochernes scorpioides]
MDASPTKIIESYRDVFDEIGTLPGEHSVILRENAQPRIQLARRIPFALKKPVEMELKSMEEQKIISKVDQPAEWAHPMNTLWTWNEAIEKEFIELKNLVSNPPVLGLFDPHRKETIDTSDLDLQNTIMTLNLKVNAKTSNAWRPATIIGEANQPRSYIIQNNEGRMLKRNRVHLRPRSYPVGQRRSSQSSPQLDPAPSTSSESSGQREPGEFPRLNLSPEELAPSTSTPIGNYNEGGTAYTTRSGRVIWQHRASTALLLVVLVVVRLLESEQLLGREEDALPSLTSGSMLELATSFQPYALVLTREELNLSKLRSGRPVTATDNAAVAAVRNVMEADRRVTIDEIMIRLPPGIEIGRSSIGKIMFDVLNFRKACAIWFPRLLSENHKQQRMEAARAFLEMHRRDGDQLFSPIVTGDESWVHQSTPETKR